MITEQERGEYLQLCDEIISVITRLDRGQVGSGADQVIEAFARSDELRDYLARGIPYISPRMVFHGAARIEWLLGDAASPSLSSLALAELGEARVLASQLHAIARAKAYRDNRGDTPAIVPVRPSHRTRCAAGLAVRLLPPADRARYREEFAAELADLPRVDQAPYAIRLVSRAWSLRRSLTSRRSQQSVSIVLVSALGADGLAWLAGIGWPAAALGAVVIAALMWTITSQDRTRRLASLIRSARRK